MRLLSDWLTYRYSTFKSLKFKWSRNRIHNVEKLENTTFQFVFSFFHHLSREAPSSNLEKTIDQVKSNKPWKFLFSRFINLWSLWTNNLLFFSQNIFWSNGTFFCYFQGSFVLKGNHFTKMLMILYCMESGMKVGALRYKHSENKSWITNWI